MLRCKKNELKFCSESIEILPKFFEIVWELIQLRSSNRNGSKICGNSCTCTSDFSRYYQSVGTPTPSTKNLFSIKIVQILKNEKIPVNQKINAKNRRILLKFF